MEYSVYSFLTDTLTKYHKLSALHNTTLFFYSPEDQRSEMGITRLKFRCQQGCVDSGGSSRESISLHFLVSRGHLHSLADSSFFHFESQQRSIFRSLSCLPHFFTLKVGL